MAHNEMRPPALDTRNGLGKRLATTLGNSEDSAPSAARQVSVFSRSISSIDSGAATPRFAAAWLARRDRISLAHAAALAEAHGIGGVA